MSNDEAITNLDGLMTSFHLEIKALPDDLKCAQCKSVLKNAYQVPCGCRFCRTCIDDVILKGNQFCPGGSQECGATPLSNALPDYSANKSVLKLTAKYPHAGCPLAYMEGYMRVCSSKNINCPFRDLVCAQGALPGEDVSGHLLQGSRSHSDILIGTVANISGDMEMLKRELLLKDEHVENEMKLLKIENESIKREKEVLCDRVRQLSEKLEREIEERRQSDERDIAMVTAVTGAVGSNRDEMKPVKGDIQSIRDQFDRMKCQMESIQVAVGLGQLDDWLIDEDVYKTAWDWKNAKTSGKFGLVPTFELALINSVTEAGGGELIFWLRICAGAGDPLLEWPLKGAVTVTVAHRDKLDVCSKQTRQCQIARPADNQYSWSDSFVFRHVALSNAGIALQWGMRVSFRIVPGLGR